MFTDSAFYSPKFHPSVAEQVEMAHRLSSSLFEDGNKTSKGQDMFLKRAKKSGKWVTTNQLSPCSEFLILNSIAVSVIWHLTTVLGIIRSVTVCKLSYFLAILILREINFGKFQQVKNCHFTYLRPSILIFGIISHLQMSKISKNAQFRAA